jgi:branched-chain amino acid transport system ATP-binding protein
MKLCEKHIWASFWRLKDRDQIPVDFPSPSVERCKMQNQNLLTVEDIHTFIGQFHILEGVTVEVPANSITVLLGRNGAGKTTTLRSIIGLNPPTKGRVRYRGVAIDGKRAYDIAQMGIGYVPDYRAVFRHLTVEENLKLAERQKDDLANKEEFIFEIFPDLKRLYYWPGGQLSGGQQQMLAVARALVPTNELLLIDEPSEGLAPVIIEQMVQAIQQLSHQTTVLLVEQNFQVARILADRYVIIEDGKSVHHGLMEDLVGDEGLVNQYLGAA